MKRREFCSIFAIPFIPTSGKLTPILQEIASLVVEYQRALKVFNAELQNTTDINGDELTALARQEARHMARIYSQWAKLFNRIAEL